MVGYGKDKSQEHTLILFCSLLNLLTTARSLISVLVQFPDFEGPWLFLGMLVVTF